MNSTNYHSGRALSLSDSIFDIIPQTYIYNYSFRFIQAFTDGETPVIWNQ